MAKRVKHTEPEDPGLLARRERRQAALAAWFRLKEACPRSWGTPIEIVSGLLMQARILTLAGPVLKVWRPEGLDVFRMAVDDRIEPPDIEPEELLARVLAWVRR